MVRRTPQEKKELSLRKDRRNVYGESPHGARTSIPQHKKLRNRANRHGQNPKLPPGTTQLAEDDADSLESAIHRKAPKLWHKVPDAPLADVVAGNRERRVNSHARKTRSKLRCAFDRGHFRGQCPGCRKDVYVLAGRHHHEHLGAFCAVGAGKPGPGFSKANIRPCRESQLPPIARRLHSLCLESTDAPLAEWICRLFGACTCPHCREPLDIAHAVKAEEAIRRVYSQRGIAATSLLDWSQPLMRWLYYQP